MRPMSDPSKDLRCVRCRPSARIVGLLGAALTAGSSGACSEGNGDFGAPPDSGFTRDAGPHDARSVDASAPQLPEIEPPVFTPCPEGWVEQRDEATELTICDPWPGSSPVQMTCPSGWRARVEGGSTLCEPFGEDGPESCGPDAAHFVGEPGCEPIGQPCTAARFAEELPDDATILYAEPGAEGGDGTPVAPFGQLSDALAAAPAGGIVALGKGRFEGPWTLSRDVTLWGACPSQTVLTAATGAEEEAVLVVTNGVELGLRNLSLRDSALAGLDVYPSSEADLDGVVIDRVSGFAVIVGTGARLTMDGSVVRSTRPDAAGRFGRALALVGSTASVRRSLFVANLNAAVSIEGASARLNAESIIVRDTAGSDASPDQGYGLWAESGATAQVTESLFEANMGAGIFASQRGRVSLSDSLVRDTLPQADSEIFGVGLDLREGASADVERTTFERNADATIYVEDLGSRVRLADVAILDTRPRALDGDYGRGLEVREGAQAEATRVVLERNRDVAIWVEDDGSSLLLSDAVVRDTQSVEGPPPWAGWYGFGLSVSDGSRAFVRRVLFAGNREWSIVALGEGTELTLDDVVARDTAARALDVEGEDAGNFGRALAVEEGAVAVARRVVSIDNRTVAILVSRGGALELEDALVARTESSLAGQFGRGLQAQRGSEATLRRVRFDDNRGVALFASESSTITATDVWASRTRPEACFFTGDCNGLADPAAGFGTSSKSRFVGTRMKSSEMELCGLLLQSEGTMDLHDSIVARNAVGACLDVSDFDLARLFNRSVFFIDNDRLVETRQLPVPDDSGGD
jgi:hypothetical protein